ncbi:hypothetical protein SK128_026526 [Halocaridina rubra]|uniref:Uncharacterized protein n=1 Tax=Halocaridina rubra TaxID=373956 RepID=A0AAN9AF20_HALRR
MAKCLRKAGIVGIVGILLVFIGLVQLIAGAYFMIVLPMFQLGSNIWTGAWCGMCGLIVAIIGWKQQTMRKGQVILVACLSVLVAEVANLVIIQVGEYRVFLTQSDRRLIVEKNQDVTMKIAFWFTTVMTALGIVVSFFGAQFLFCVVVRGPRIKGRMPITRSLSEEDLHHRQVQVTRLTSRSISDDIGVDFSERRMSSSNGSVHAHVVSGDGNDQIGPQVLNTTDSNKDDERRGHDAGPYISVIGGEPGAEPQKKLNKQSPKTPEECVPYFLRNHRSVWQFILPEVVREMRTSSGFSVTESFIDVHSRTSTLSKTSKSSFQPYRPNPLVHGTSLDITEMNHLPSGQDSIVQGACIAPSSCNTSVYSIPEVCRKSGSRSPSGSRIKRPNIPPPLPPSSKSSSSGRGWESCAVLQYPLQLGDGYIVDLD